MAGDDLSSNPGYLEAVKEAVAEFEAAFRSFLELHVVTTSPGFGPRGIIPAAMPKQGVDAGELENRRTAVAVAAGKASTAPGLTGTFVMVQGIGQVDPIAAWDSVTKPKPVLEPDDVLSAVSMILGRLDALLMQAKFSTSDEDSQVSEKTITAVEPSRRPRVFIGSSSEGLAQAKAVQSLLKHVAEAEVWANGVFQPGPTVIERLVTVAPTFDFGVLIVNPDDTTVSRGEEHNVMRDNVVFELGLFMGAVGRERVFMVHEHGKPPEFPSDLLGTIPATYFPHSEGNWVAALGPAVNDIESVIGRLGLRS